MTAYNNGVIQNLGVVFAVLGVFTILGVLVIVLEVVNSRWKVTNTEFLYMSFFRKKRFPLQTIARLYATYGVPGHHQTIERVASSLSRPWGGLMRLFIDIRESSGKTRVHPLAHVGYDVSASGGGFVRPPNSKGLHEAIMELQHRLPGVVDASAIEFLERVKRGK